ncbi:MAG: hypothetical protein ABIV50_15225 [Opitutus sp.]
MRSKLSLIVTLFAWLLATGSHWDLVQTYAWGTMIADYSREMSLSEAVKKTFSPQTMCHLCHAVADAKKSSDENSATPGPKSPGKILLACVASRAESFDPTLQCIGRVCLDNLGAGLDRAVPAVPPPRSGC